MFILICSTFTNNSNLKTQLPPEFEHHFGISGAIVGFRFPISFNGINIFQSNLGGGMNINHARIRFKGHVKFHNHQLNGFGGAIRLGELTLVSYATVYLLLLLIIR